LAVGCQGERPKPDAPEAGPSASKPAEQKPSEARALDDPTVQHEMVSFKSGTDVVEGYVARPKAEGHYRAVLVLHGEFGVPEGMRNTAAQLAQAGFVVLACKRFSRWPDLTPQDVMRSDQSDQRFRSMSFVEQELHDAQAAIDHLQTQPAVKPGGVGVVGFCGGGYEALLLATRSKDIRAVVAFYAPPEAKGEYQHPTDPKPSLMEKVAQINVPVQGHYGADDPLVPLEDVRRFEQALKARGTPASFFTYEGATHGFYDSSRRFYHAEAAERAKRRMLDFLKEHLQ
jgi:carboxymethylenebutenolidase